VNTLPDSALATIRAQAALDHAANPGGPLSADLVAKLRVLFRWPVVEQGGKAA
jgi:hypothetical protein